VDLLPKHFEVIDGLGLQRKDAGGVPLIRKGGSSPGRRLTEASPVAKKRRVVPSPLPSAEHPSAKKTRLIKVSRIIAHAWLPIYV
jgi:hypothetical protein